MQVTKDSMEKLMHAPPPSDTTQEVPLGALRCLKPIINFLAELTPGQMMALQVAAALIGLFVLITFWRLFTKAGQPGWAILIPIYNIIVMLRVAGRPWWWLFLLILIIPALFIPFDMAKSFGKSTAFGVGLLFLGIIFYPILAFGNAVYVGPRGVPVQK
jgi:hypothetical protein